MVDQQRIPRGLVGMPPGLGLACALAEIDAFAVSGFDAVDVLRAQQRQLNHERARLLTARGRYSPPQPDCSPVGQSGGEPRG